MVLPDVADPRQRLGLVGPGGVTEHLDLPLGGLEQPDDHFKQRRLARAVRADQAHDGAGGDGERTIPQSPHLTAVALAEPGGPERGNAAARVVVRHETFSFLRSWRTTAISAVTASSLSPAASASRNHCSSDSRRAPCAPRRAGADAVMNVPWPGRPPARPS